MKQFKRHRVPWASELGGPNLKLGWIYGLALLAIGGLLIYEHALVRADDLTRVNVAFFQVNVVISFGLLLGTAVDLWS